MKVVSRHNVGEPAWNQCVAASREAWLFHDWAWIEIERTFFAASEHSFALEEGGVIVGVNPLYLAGPAQGMGDEHLLHCGVHRHATLALKDALDPSTAKAARSAAMRHIIEFAREKDVDRIHFGLQTAAPAFHADKRAEVPFFARDYGFQVGISFGPYGISPCPGLTTLAADQVVMLDSDEAVLFQGLDESCRRAVRRAQKAQLNWTIGSALEGLDTYLALAARSATRTGEALPPADYYRAICRAFDGQGRVRIAFSRQGDTPVAALLVLIDKASINYLAGVSEPAALETRCNDHIHWGMIAWGRQVGHHIYRLGPSFPEVPREWPIARVSAFKTKFGARSIPLVYASLYRRPEKYLARLPARFSELSAVSYLEAPSAGNATPKVIA